MTDKERLAAINENWGNYPTETTKGMTALCRDFEWLLKQAEKAQDYEETLNFYANEANYESPIYDEYGQFNGSLVDKDNGEIARKVLEDY